MQKQCNHYNIYIFTKVSYLLDRIMPDENDKGDEVTEKSGGDSRYPNGSQKVGILAKGHDLRY